MKTFQLLFVVMAIALLVGCQKNESVLQPVYVEPVFSSSFNYDQLQDKTLLSVTYNSQGDTDTFNLNHQFQGSILRQTKDIAYIGTSAVGIGGYILYGHYTLVLKYDNRNHSFSRLTGETTIMDVDFDNNLQSMVYTMGERIVLKNLNDNSELFFTPTWASGSQVGDFKFSPDGREIVMAVGWGPENEHGAIYVLNLETRKFRLVKETTYIPQVIGWGLYK